MQDRGRADPARRARRRARRGRGGPRHAEAVQEARRAVPVLVQAGREASGSRGRRRSIRPRSRTRSSRPGSRSRSSTTRGAVGLGHRLDEYRTQLGEQWHGFTEVAADEPAGVVPDRADGRRDRHADARRTGWSATRTRSTWSRSWTSTWPAAADRRADETADALGVPRDQRVYLRGLELRDRPDLRGRARRPVAVARDGVRGGDRASVPRAWASTTSRTSTCTRASARR